MDLGSQPPSSLQQTLEEGYFVKICYLDLEESGSGACTKDNFGYGILINSNEVLWRMNFSLAKEYSFNPRYLTGDEFVNKMLQVLLNRRESTP